MISRPVLRGGIARWRCESAGGTPDAVAIVPFPLPGCRCQIAVDLKQFEKPGVRAHGVAAPWGSIRVQFDESAGFGGGSAEVQEEAHADGGEERKCRSVDDDDLGMMHDDAVELKCGVFWDVEVAASPMSLIKTVSLTWEISTLSVAAMRCLQAEKSMVYRGLFGGSMRLHMFGAYKE